MFDWTRFLSVIGIAIGVLIAFRLLLLIVEHWLMFRGIMAYAVFAWFGFGVMGIFDKSMVLTFDQWLIGGLILFLGGGFALFLFLIFLGWGAGKVEQAIDRHEGRKEDVEWLMKQHEKHYILPPLNVVGQVVYDPPQKPKTAPKPKREKRSRDYNSRTRTFTSDNGETVMDCGNGISVKQTQGGVCVKRNGFTEYSGKSVDEALEAVRKACKQ